MTRSVPTLAALALSLAALTAGSASAQTAGLTASDQYFLYFNAQSSARQLQRTQLEHQKAIKALQAPSPAARQRVAPSTRTLADDEDTGPNPRSPQLTARPLPAIYGGPGATRQYFGRNSYFNPR